MTPLNVQYTCSHPERRDAQGGPLLVIGCAENVWEDLREARAQWPTATLMAINEVGMFLKCPVRYWFSGHAHILHLWLRVRESQMGPAYGAHPELLSCRRGPDVSTWWNFPAPDVQGFMDDAKLEDSAFLGALVGLLLGYNPVVFCGCPCNGWGHAYYGYQLDRQLLASKEPRAAAMRRLRAAQPALQERLRSMSGLTADIFGRPEACVPVG